MSRDSTSGGAAIGQGTALRIAIIGAESTGKTVLAQGLATRLAELTGLRCTAVGEWLRHWCDAQGRTPRPDEQRAIAEHQQALIDAAATAHNIVVCDTTPLMTAIYSAMLFDDTSLVPYAVEQQRRCTLTLLTALDLPWVADGLQRDGPQVRGPVDDRVRALLIGHGLPWSLVAGSGAARLEAALDAVAPVLRGRLAQGDALAAVVADAQPGVQAAAPPAAAGLFSRLAAREAALPYADGSWRWACDCDVPGCEHLLRQPQRQG